MFEMVFHELFQFLRFYLTNLNKCLLGLLLLFCLYLLLNQCLKLTLWRRFFLILFIFLYVVKLISGLSQSFAFSFSEDPSFFDAPFFFRRHKFIISLKSWVVHMAVDCKFYNFWLIIFEIVSLFVILSFYVPDQGITHWIILSLPFKGRFSRSSTSTSGLRFCLWFVWKHK